MVQYFYQCNEVEYKEVLILLAWTGGLGWNEKDCGYAFGILGSLSNHDDDGNKNLTNLHICQ